jgi:hypothetical protein
LPQDVAELVRVGVDEPGEERLPRALHDHGPLGQRDDVTDRLDLPVVDQHVRARENALPVEHARAADQEIGGRGRDRGAAEEENEEREASRHGSVSTKGRDVDGISVCPVGFPTRFAYSWLERTGGGPNKEKVMKRKLAIVVLMACAALLCASEGNAGTSVNGSNLNGSNLNGNNLNGQNLNGFRTAGRVGIDFVGIGSSPLARRAGK